MADQYENVDNKLKKLYKFLGFESERLNFEDFKKCMEVYAEERQIDLKKACERIYNKITKYGELTRKRRDEKKHYRKYLIGIKQKNQKNVNSDGYTVAINSSDKGITITGELQKEMFYARAEEVISTIGKSHHKSITELEDMFRFFYYLSDPTAELDLNQVNQITNDLFNTLKFYDENNNKIRCKDFNQKRGHKIDFNNVKTTFSNDQLNTLQQVIEHFPEMRINHDIESYEVSISILYDLNNATNKPRNSPSIH